jgi:hypothetical protein
MSARAGSIQTIELSIQELDEHVKSGNLVLEKQVQKEKDGASKSAGAPAAKYYWNIRGKRAKIVIVVGNPARMDSADYEAPYLLLKPEEYKDPSGKTVRDESRCPTYGAFTALPDPEEAAAWARFNEHVIDTIIGAKLVALTKESEKMPEEYQRMFLLNKIAQPVKLPEERDDGKRRNVCITQKLSMDPLEWKGTKFFTIRIVHGENKIAKKKITLERAEELMNTGAKITSKVELGECKFVLEKWRTMMYTREVYLLPASQSAAGTEVLCGMAVVDEDDDPAPGAGLGVATASAAAGGSGSSGAGGGCSAVDTSAAAATATGSDDVESDLANISAYQASLLRETEGGGSDDDGGDDDDDGDADEERASKRLRT